MSALPPLTIDEFMIARAVDRVKEIDPELWRLCYPRIYEEPKAGRYYSPKDVAAQLVEITLKVRHGFRGDAEMYEFQFASAAARYRVPIFWISPHLMEAMKHTAPPSDFAWMSMNLPFDAAVFMVPKGTLKHKEEGEVRWIGYGRFQEGQREKSVLHPASMYGVVNGGMLLVAKTEQGLFHHWNMPADSLGPYISLADIDEYKNGLEPHTSSKGLSAHVITPEDNLLFVEVAHYIFSTLLIMTERPDILECGEMRKRVSKHGDTKEFWSPNVIGGTYRVQAERGDAVGTHAGPRLHFVRGFWRQQAYGPQRSLRKPKWIEPFLRGS